jgi:outer membrane biosynthesis protein TonB
MKKRIIIAAAITACLALCAAMWPQAETVGETPAVIVPEAAVVELKTEAETALPSEKEKTAIPQPEQTQEAVTEPKSAPAETPAVQSAPEPEPVPEVSYGLAPEQAAEPHVAKTTIEPPSGDMVYVPGFGWIQSEGPNHVEYAEDMYENGNKIGIMG